MDLLRHLRFFSGLPAQDKSIVARTATLIVLLCVSMIGFIAWSSWDGYRRDVAKAKTTTLNQATSVAQQAANAIAVVDLVLMEIVERMEVEGRSAAAMERLHHVLTGQTAKLTQVQGLFVFDEHGTQLAGTRTGDPERLPLFNQEDFNFHRSRPDRNVHIGTPMQVGASTDWIIPVSRRIDYPDGRFAGMAVAALQASYFRRFYSTFEIGQHGSILLWLADGTLLVRHPLNAATIGKRHPAGLITQHKFTQEAGNTIQYSPVDKTEKMYGYRRVNGYPLIVACAAEMSEVLAGWRAATYRTVAGLCLLLIAIGLLSYRLIVQIHRKVEAERLREVADAFIREQASLLDQAKDAIIVMDLKRHIRFWNKGAERLYGWSTKEVPGHRFDVLLTDRQTEGFEQAFRAVLDQGEWSHESTRRCKSGAMVPIEEQWTLVRDQHGAPVSIFVIETDITARKNAASVIHELAFYDSLTQLPNRSLLLDRVQQARASNARSRQIGALFFIDLDNFKALNDTYGHAKGDLLLQKVARRLSACVRESDTVARLGGDEFVVMLVQLGEDVDVAHAHASKVGEKILAAFSQPFDLVSHQYSTTPSIGVAFFSGKELSAEEIMKRADLAMYQAKAAGRNAVQFYDPTMQEMFNARAALESDLQQAIANRELLLHYQPQINQEGDISGVEALVRWHHPAKGLISPGVFIPIAEASGLIMTIGNWILRASCEQLQRWSTHPQAASLTISVNVSAKQFRDASFVNQVVGAIDDYGIDPSKLKLELTESILIENIEATIKTMGILRQKGVRFSLDDFGTGYSSLSYLNRMPVDQLKIDQSFVKGMVTDASSAAIIRTILALGKSLGQHVIAEGVETREMYELLKAESCQAFQGYYFSRPLPPDEVQQLIVGRNELRKWDDFAVS